MRSASPRYIAWILVVAILAHAAPVRASSSETLAQARQALKEADYDTSINLLREALEESTMDIELRRESYKLLINTYWQGSNYLKDKPQYHEASVLYSREAESLIRSCLSEEELRDTQMKGLQYPESLRRTFTEIRGEMFGELRIEMVEPSEATIVLDADTLRIDETTGPLRIESLPVGEHTLLVFAKGRRSHEEMLWVEPSLVVERDITLDKSRGVLWYATIGVGVAAAAVVVAVLSGSEDDPATVEDPLPEPPDPPAGKRR